MLFRKPKPDRVLKSASSSPSSKAAPEEFRKAMKIR
jgi:hypothetical protein